MKIYQVHRTGGCWEDYYNIIEGTFLNEENAHKMIDSFNSTQDVKIHQAQVCFNCSENEYNNEDCIHREIHPDYDGCEYCVNEVIFYDVDKENFSIEEVTILDA